MTGGDGGQLASTATGKTKERLLQHFVSAGERQACPPVEVAIAAVEIQPARSVSGTLGLLLLRFRVARARRRLLASGASDIVAFGLYPSLEKPAIVYEIGSAAGRYAEERMLHGSSIGSTMGAFLRAVAGCDPRLGAVVLVGRSR